MEVNQTVLLLVVILLIAVVAAWKRGMIQIKSWCDTETEAYKLKTPTHWR